MGSLTSSTRTPAPAQRVIFAPPSSTPSSAETSSEPTQRERDIETSEQRSQDLLRRNRGVFGTVNTSLQGLLNATTTSQRKTLLGE